VPTNDLRIKRAILGLGAEKHQDREAATHWLLEAGEPALPPLKAATGSPDPEVRLRAEKLVMYISSGITPSTPSEIREFLRRFSEADSREKARIAGTTHELGFRFAWAVLKIYVRSDAKEQWRQRFVDSLGLLMIDPLTKKEDIITLSACVLQTDDEPLHSVLLSSLKKPALRDVGTNVYLNALQHGPSRPLLLRQTVSFLQAVGDYDQAVRLVEERMQDKVALTKETVVNALFVCENNLRSEERAAGLYDKLVELDPKNADNYYGRAHNYHWIEKYKEAAANYTKALDLGYDDVHMIYENRAICYRELKLWDKALEDFTKVIELHPDDRYWYSERGHVFLNQGKLKEAAADFERAMGFEPRTTSEQRFREAVQKERDSVLQKLKTEDSDKLRKLRGQAFNND
jgi:tetratricopeptide (TPR) repeat protein